MQTFILLGSTASPGYAGDWVTILVVTAKDIASAAKKLRGTLSDGDRHPEQRFFDPGRKTAPLIRRAVASDLRRWTGRRPEPHDVDRHVRRYSSFQVKRMPRVR